MSRGSSCRWGGLALDATSSTGGKKSEPREEPDAQKQRAAEIFYEKWRTTAEDAEYLRLKEEHRRRSA
jgi:hypothetical protein